MATTKAEKKLAGQALARSIATTIRTGQVVTQKMENLAINGCEGGSMATTKAEKKLAGQALARSIAAERIRTGQVVTQKMQNLAINGYEGGSVRHGAQNNNRSKIFVEFLSTNFGLGGSSWENKKVSRVKMVRKEEMVSHCHKDPRNC